MAVSDPDLIGPMRIPSGGAYLIMLPHPAIPQWFPANLPLQSHRHHKFAQCHSQGSRVTFSKKMLLWRGIQGASKNPLGSFQLHEVLEIWPFQVSVFNGKYMEEPTKKTRFPTIFGTFPIVMYFWKGESRCIQKTQARPPKQPSYLRYGRRKFHFY